jgi:hypothetical protein
MFQANDKVRIDKPFDQHVSATILKIDENGRRSVALVRRDDDQQEDVWAWHPAQVGVSVHKL